MKNWFLIFIYALGLNFIWENAHSFLYIHYRGEVITEYILLRASFVDASIIFGLAVILHLFTFSRLRPWLLIVGGVMVSIVIEYWALGTGRWGYTDMMPLVPFLTIGLTPTIQLGLTGYLVHKVVFKEKD